MSFVTNGKNGMTLKEAFETVFDVLQTMQTGEIRLFVKKGEITHVNRTEEVYPKRYDPQSADIIKFREEK